MGVLVNQLRQNGVTVPVLGGASLNLAKDAGDPDLTDLVVIDDCVPELDKAKNVEEFVKAYDAGYGYAPNYASAQVYDAFHIAANAVEKAGHDHAAINKATRGNGLRRHVRLQGGQEQRPGQLGDRLRLRRRRHQKLLKTYPLAYVPADEVQGAATTTTAAPATSRSVDVRRGTPRRIYRGGAPAGTVGVLESFDLRRSVVGVLDRPLRGAECRRDPLLLGAAARRSARACRAPTLGLGELVAGVGERGLQVGDVPVRLVEPLGGLGGRFGELSHRRPPTSSARSRAAASSARAATCREFVARRWRGAGSARCVGASRGVGRVVVAESRTGPRARAPG